MTNNIDVILMRSMYKIDRRGEGVGSKNHILGLGQTPFSFCFVFAFVAFERRVVYLCKIDSLHLLLKI